MSIDNVVRYEPFSWSTYANDPQPCRIWSEAGHMTNDGYHSPSVNMEFKNGNRYEFIDQTGYDSFRTQFPDHHKTISDFGNRNINKLDSGW